MENTAAVAFGAAVAGALAGGVLSAVAGAWVTRYEHRRAERIKIFRDLLPPMLKEARETLDSANRGMFHPLPPTFRRPYEQLIRTAQVTSGGDWRYVSKMTTPVIELEDIAKTYFTGESTTRERRSAASEKSKQPLGELYVALAAYENWIDGRVNGRFRLWRGDVAVRIRQRLRGLSWRRN